MNEFETEVTLGGKSVNPAMVKLMLQSVDAPSKPASLLQAPEAIFDSHTSGYYGGSLSTSPDEFEEALDSARDEFDKFDEQHS